VIDYWGWYIPNTAVIMPSYPLMVVQLGSQHFLQGTSDEHPQIFWDTKSIPGIPMDIFRSF
jgi:hypothetical protein